MTGRICLACLLYVCNVLSILQEIKAEKYFALVNSLLFFNCRLNDHDFTFHITVDADLFHNM
jgi:hypothetical protein